jgi:hypothetical protein
VAGQCSKLATWLPSLGGEVTVKKVSGTVDPDTGTPAPHSWALLKVNQMLNVFDGKVVDRRPTRVHALVAEDSVVGAVSIEQRNAGAFSALDAESGPQLRVTAVDNVRGVALDAGGATADRRVHAMPVDGMAFDLRLSGFASRPSYVSAAGSSALIPDVRSDPLADALVVTVAGDGLEASVIARADWNASLTVTPDPAPLGARIHLVADGPATARTAWLVFGMNEALFPVLGSAATLGLVPRSPAFIQHVTLDPGGDIEWEPLLPPTLPTPGGHIHVQALFFDAGQAPVSTSNVWMLRWSN